MASAPGCCSQVPAPRGPRQGALAQQAPAATAFNPDHIGVRELTLHLKPRQREEIDPLCFSGYTQAEPAEELGIPPATVKTRTRAALLVLAKAAR